MEPTSQTQRSNVSQTQPYQAVTQPLELEPALVASCGLEPAVFKFQQDTKEAFVGRHKDCQMQAKDKHVSQKHLRVFRNGEHFYLEELGLSGCFIGTQIMKKGETRTLVHGDKITIAADPNAEAPFATIFFQQACAPSSAPTSQEGAEASMVNGVSDRWVRSTWSITNRLGSGNFSEVRHGFEVKDPSKQYAVKIVDKQKFLQFQSKRGSVLSLEDEAKTMMSLCHPDIVKCHSWFQTHTSLYLALELVEGGDLLHCLLETGCFPECQAARLFGDICSAVKYLHEKKLVHRDLKPENILLSSKDRATMVPKLADFGLARKNVGTRDCRTFCGTPHYFAPEVITTFSHSDASCSGYGKPVDMWSLGVILYILLSGIPPFEEDKLYQQIVDGNYAFDVAEWQRVGFEAKELVKKLMTVNPRQRLTIKEALDHCWFKVARLVSACTPARSSELGGFEEPAAKRRRSEVSMG